MVISVHSGKFPGEKRTADIGEAVARHGIRSPVVNDADFRVWQSYAVRAWPTLVLIDPSGRIVRTQSGEIRAEDLAPVIAGMVQEFDASGQLDRRPLGGLRADALAHPDRPLSYPGKVLATHDGRLFIADTGHHRILEVRLDGEGAAGEVVRVFGSGRAALRDGPGAEAAFHSPHGMALGGSTLYVADTENHAVRAIELEGATVRTVAGTGEKGQGRAVPGAPPETPLRSPWALLAADDLLFIAMAGSHQIWVLLGEGRIGVFAGNGREALVDGPRGEASFNQPSDLAEGFGYLFVADAEASAVRAVSLDEAPAVHTLVGQGLFEWGDVDGVGAEVRLQHATGIAVHGDLLYIADSYNHKVKTLDPATGAVRTLIGTGQSGAADGAFTEAELYEPEGLSFASGRMYIADTNNHRVRVADLATATVRTLTLRGLERLPPAAPKT